MKFFIMDGRARFDIDRATIVEVCDSKREAVKALKDYYKDMDYVVENTNLTKVVYDPIRGY